MTMLRIGVDGGGTTTRAVVVDEKLQVLGRGESGSSNHYSVGLERAVHHIEAATRDALTAFWTQAASSAPDLTDAATRVSFGVWAWRALARRPNKPCCVALCIRSWRVWV